MTCPHCHGQDLQPANGDTRLGRCGSCGFTFPLPVAEADDSTWRQQADAEADALPGWPKLRGDRYRIIRPLATGAQGRILLAHHRHLDQICVVKILDVEDEWRQVAEARLRTEARAGVMVSHRNVARVLDCDCIEGVWYFVMEYVPGENLRDIVRGAGRLCWAQVVALAADVADGLAAVHAAGLIHRDIKPSNIMLRNDGIPKIMDLGLVKIAGRPMDMALTQDGQLLGTPYYMAPEQFALDGEITSQVDIYGLGATMYHLLAGRPPHRGAGVLELANRHRHDPVVWCDAVIRSVPSWVRHVVETCLAKQPEHRFTSATALREALLSGMDVRSPVMAPPQQPGPRGIAVMALRNLSRDEADEWIGDAVAEYLSNRLRELEGLNVVDRQAVARLLTQQGGAPCDEATDEQLVAAARLLGAGLVVVGSFQRSGDQLRISARTVGNAGGAAERLAVNISGTIARLFNLEDDLASELIEALGREGSADSGAPARGTQSIEAQEKLVRGRRLFADGDYQGAIEAADQALADDPDFIDAVSLVGACYARIGDYDRAVEYHRREEERARQEGDMRRLAEALGNVGVMYYYKGEYGLAYEFLAKARNIGAEEAFFADTAKYQANLGFVLMRLNRFEEAETAFAQAIDINKKYGDLVSLAWPYNGMGSVLLKQRRYAEAADFYRRARSLAEEIGDRVNVGVSHMNLGRCACLMGQFAEAEACFDEALQTLEGTDFWNGLTLVYEHMADMYLQEGNTAAAMHAIDKRLELAIKHGNQRMEAEAWEQKAKAHELAGSKDDAVRCLKRSIEISQRPVPHESLNRYLSEITKRPPFA